MKHTLLHIGLARLATESRKTAWTYDINTDTISSISQISADQSNKCILKSHWAALFWYNNESGHVNYTRQCPRAAWWCSRRIAKSETCEVSFSNVENTFLADCDNWWPRNHFLMTATPAATLGSSMWPGSSTTLIFWQSIWKDCLHSLQLKEIDEIVSVFMSYALAVYLDSVANLQTYDECAIICNFSSISADQSIRVIKDQFVFTFMQRLSRAKRKLLPRVSLQSCFLSSRRIEMLDLEVGPAPTRSTWNVAKLEREEEKKWVA